MELKTMHKTFIEQVILTLDKKDKGNYFLLIGMGTFLNFNIREINEIIEIVRELRKNENVTQNMIIDFIFQSKPVDEKFI